MYICTYIVHFALEERVLDVPRRGQECQDEHQKFGLAYEFEFLGSIPTRNISKKHHLIRME